MEQRIIAQLKAFVNSQYGGDPHAAFVAYAQADNTDHMTQQGLTYLLEAANVGFFSRAIAAGVFEHLNAADIGYITWEQVQDQVEAAMQSP